MRSISSILTPQYLMQQTPSTRFSSFFDVHIYPYSPFILSLIIFCTSLVLYLLSFTIYTVFTVGTHIVPSCPGVFLYTKLLLILNNCVPSLVFTAARMCTYLTIFPVRALISHSLLCLTRLTLSTINTIVVLYT